MAGGAHAVKAMLDYRWFLVGPDERTYSRREYPAKDDAEAVEFARELSLIYTECNGTDFAVELWELWEKQRLVFSESIRGKPITPYSPAFSSP